MKGTAILPQWEELTEEQRNRMFAAAMPNPMRAMFNVRAVYDAAREMILSENR